MSTDYASESGHWYTRSGAPCYKVKGKNGKIRNTTLRDARSLKLVPSVTEVMKIVAKPGLERWKLEQIKLSSLTLPRNEGETLDEFSERIDGDANKQAIDARNEGTSIHGAIELYFKYGKIINHQAIVEELISVLKTEFGEQSWSSEKSFAHPSGFGGKVDLFSNEWVIDFKTKDFSKKDLKKTLAIPDNLMQLSAYKLGLNLKKAKTASIFISRTEDGLIKVEKHEKKLNFSFGKLLSFWMTFKDYDSSYSESNIAPPNEEQAYDRNSKRKENF